MIDNGHRCRLQAVPGRKSSVNVGLYLTGFYNESSKKYIF